MEAEGLSCLPVAHGGILIGTIDAEALARANSHLDDADAQAA
jgi:predicted transcriptional regulator